MAHLSPIISESVSQRPSEGKNLHCRSPVRLSASSVVKWSRWWRVTGSADASPMGGKRRDVMAPGRNYALARLARHPAPAPWRTASARDQGEPRRAVAFRPCRGPVVQEKTVLAGKMERYDIASRRGRWRWHQHRIDTRRLVFLDEAWVKTNRAPLRGWGRRAPACWAAHPSGTGAGRPSWGAASGPDRRALCLRRPDQWRVGSVPMSSGCSSPHCARATWWSWTISAATRASQGERPLGSQVRICCSSRHAARL